MENWFDSFIYLSAGTVANINDNIHVGQPLPKFLCPVRQCWQWHNYKKWAIDFLSILQQICQILILKDNFIHHNDDKQIQWEIITWRKPSMETDWIVFPRPISSASITLVSFLHLWHKSNNQKTKYLYYVVHICTFILILRTHWQESLVLPTDNHEACQLLAILAGHQASSN